ncbi:MAG: gamma-glutamyltransferase [Planctomycetes bacterium]|nr:gamma-glutamyltransferase [Planctomycetota bacterium]
MYLCVSLVLLVALGSACVFASIAPSEIGWQASGRLGVVAAGGAASVAAGIHILEEGGNAADAAVATLLALSVTDYGLFAIGGEAPLIIYDSRSGQVKALCGAGRAPRGAEAINWLMENGIPDTGSYKAMPCPGAVDLCLETLRLYGTKCFESVAMPVLDLLDAGDEPWHPKQAATLRKMVAAERGAPGSREQKLMAARDRFYRGDIAEDLERWWISVGALLRKGDLAAQAVTVERPVSVRYRGYVIHKCNTWTQGPVLCQTMRLVEGFDLGSLGHLSADYVHVLTEAMKLAYADRDTYYGDPEFVDVPLEALLSDEYTQIRRALIDMDVASARRRPGDPERLKPLKAGAGEGDNPVRTPISDTTTCVVSDRWGNLVAATPSCNLADNQPDPITGVTQGNRVRCLNTTFGHPNCLQAGKRPRITLTPTIVTKDGKPVAAISVAGGDLQDQTTLNVLLGYIEFGMSPAEAVTAPRFSTDHMENSFDSNPDRSRAFMHPLRLHVSSGIAREVQDELKRRGHELETTAGPIADPVMIALDPGTGEAHVAGDPQAGRHAAAVESAG